MSVYLTRVIEVKRKDVIAYFKDEDTIKANVDGLEDGDTFGVYNDREFGFRIWDSGKNEFRKSKTCREKWELVKYYVRNENSKKWGYFSDYEKSSMVKPCDGWFLKKHADFSNNGGDIRDEFIHNTWDTNKYGIEDRGFPSDISEEALDEIHENQYMFGKTYVMLDELESISERVLSEFKSKMKGSVMNIRLSELNDKVDSLVKNENYQQRTPRLDCEGNPYDDDPEGDFESMFEEYTDLLSSLDCEIGYIYRIANEYVDSYLLSSQIRIIYYLE